MFYEDNVGPAGLPASRSPDSFFSNSVEAQAT